MKHNIVKASLISPKTINAKPMENALVALDILKNLKSDIALFPELSITSYSCDDLFFSEDLIKENDEALKHIIENNLYKGIAVIGGLYLDKESDQLFNAAYVIQEHKVLGIVPKYYLPDYDEFNETRYFASGNTSKKRNVLFLGNKVPFGRLLFSTEDESLTFGVEICEDVWAPIPESTYMALAGANMTLNLSASTEYLLKDKIRHNMILETSRRNRGAYLYASSSASETSAPTIFSSTLIGASLGEELVYSNEPSLDTITKECLIDLSQINAKRRSDNVFIESKKKNHNVYRKIVLHLNDVDYKLEVEKHPFWFKDSEYSKVERVLTLQSLALSKRLSHIGSKKVIIGVSGGLDSTLSLLVAYRASQLLNKDPKDFILPVFLPSSNSSTNTKSNSKKLTDALGLTPMVLPIHKEVESILLSINHQEKDVTYENAQARVRTLYLMELGNKYNGLMLGTSDLSEIALGYSTFNGDQMSMFNVNSSIPKTMMQSMFVLLSKHTTNELLKEVLMDIVKTPISAELNEGQFTENEVGKYEYTDFIIYRMFKMKDSKSQILALLIDNFDMDLTQANQVFDKFYKRLITSQFKRNTSPDSPKVTPYSLDSKTDFKLRSDAKR